MTTGSKFEDAYSLFIEAKAAKSKETQAQLVQQISSEQFLSTLLLLNEQLQNGEFSEGYMAEQLGIAQIDLIHIRLMLDL